MQRRPIVNINGDFHELPDSDTLMGGLSNDNTTVEVKMSISDRSRYPAPHLTAQKPSKCGQTPLKARAWQSVGVATGVLTKLPNRACIFSLRNYSQDNSLLIRNFGLGLIMVEAFKHPQRMEFGLYVARNFITSDGGGNVVPQHADNSKLNTSFATVSGVDIRVSAYNSLVPGRRTLDMTPVSMQACWAEGEGTAIVPTKYNMLSLESSDYPLTLAPDEGIVVLCGNMGEGGQAIVYYNFDYAEVSPT